MEEKMKLVFRTSITIAVVLFISFMMIGFLGCPAPGGPDTDPPVQETPEAPTAEPTAAPTDELTPMPTAIPTDEPTSVPTAVPTDEPPARGTLIGDFYISPESKDVIGSTFTVDVYVNTEGKHLAAFGFNLDWDSSCFSVDTSIGTTGVTTTTTGTNLAVNANDAGVIRVSGFNMNANGIENVGNYAIVTVNFNIISGTHGTKTIVLTPRDMADKDSMAITPLRGFGGTIVVP
jgi:hypothetical protein